MVPKNFTASGPVANAKIDAVIQEYMATLGTRHAGLAIVHGSKLVYARGYTLAEPDWPIAQPTTCFRLASVSKTVTALVIYQLIQQGLVQVTDTLQGILGVQTPTGGTPADSRFSQITIRQLLDHTSGLAPQANDDAIGILNAFNAVNPGAYSLPVSAAMTDSYVASLPLVSDPAQPRSTTTAPTTFWGASSPSCAIRVCPSMLTSSIFSTRFPSRVFGTVRA